MRRLRTFAAVASIAVIAACGGNDNDDDTTAVPEDGSGSSGAESAEGGAPIVGTQWVLDGLDTADVSLEAADGTSAYLRINEAGEVEGSTGCNSFGGSAEVGDEVITFQPLLATKKGCSGELGEIDSAMLGVLRGDVQADVAGNALTLTDADGETLTLTVGEPPSTDS